MKEEKVILPLVIIAVIVLVGLTSGVLTVKNPFISTSSVNAQLGGKWNIQNYYTGNNSITEILSDSQGDVLVVTQYSFSSASQAQSFFYSNQLSSPEQYGNYMISYYAHGLSESVYILSGSKVYYVSYVATTSLSLPSISQLVNLIK
ncbi:hypothetical protein V6M85_08530 [Sulfolobus tengchongensis]|uniref:DUF4367 domain-containing protein n=1 Tax=Sulfolobus tengchongensis TaxID=207809 RepID=A0AAX4KXC6_9CREN